MDHEEPKHPKNFEKPVPPDSKSRSGGTALLPPPRLRQAGDILTTVIFYLAILFFIIGFNFSHNPAGNWYQQFMPNIGSKQINDITFIDSLTGFSVASRNVNPDTASILRTTDGGDTWQIIFTQTPRRFSKIKFINSLTGFISGGSGSGTPYLYKSTDAGNNWTTVTGATLGTAYWNDMAVLNEDTIWLVDANSLNGGVFFTTNGGANWQNQLSLGSSNPNHIYFYNGRLGFIARDNTYLRRTTDGGATWNVVPGAGGFLDMHFADSLTGWKTSFQKTTDGGLSWVNQVLPSGGNIITSQIVKFLNLGVDTIWGVGGHVFLSGQGNRGMIYRTINSGNSWLFQIPDTSINIGTYRYTDFYNSLIGWAYSSGPGVHTTTGGDPIWYTPLTQINNEVPKEYKLFNNYPNPFNPVTVIKFQVSKLSDLKIIVYSVQGKQITELVNQKQSAGTYEVTFAGSNYSSGVYFYSLIIDGKLIDTKKMILLK